jgi:hypothetical protein
MLAIEIEISAKAHAIICSYRMNVLAMVADKGRENRDFHDGCC